MKILLKACVVLALAGPVLATPKVSGDGACGIRAVDNAAFVTCENDAALEPVDRAPSAEAFEPPHPIAVTSRQAWQIKRDLGKRVLLVDIRARSEFAFAGMPFGVDAQLPFMEPSPGFFVKVSDGHLEMDFNYRFLERLDEQLVQAGLRHGDPVILLSPSAQRSRLAAALMGEHGYLQVFVITDGGWTNEAPGRAAAGR